MPQQYLSDEEVFGKPQANAQYLSDEEVFGAPARPAAAAKPRYLSEDEMTAPDNRTEVGALESAGRGWIESNAKLGKYLGLAASAPAVLFDKAKSAITGEETTAAGDYALKNFVDPYQASIDRYGVHADEKQNFGGKVAGAVGGLAADLPLIIASGGASAPAQLAKYAPTTGEYVGEALHRGFDAMRPVMVKSGAEKAEEVLNRGGSTTQAVNAGATAAMLSGFQGAAPMSLEGRLATRVASGIPVGMATGEAARQIQNAAMPEGMEHKFDLEEAGVAGVTGGILAGAMGHGPAEVWRPPAAADIERITSSNLPVHEQLQAIRALGEGEPVDESLVSAPRATPEGVAADVWRRPVEPSTEILKAQSVDEAIAAAKVEMPKAAEPLADAVDVSVAADVVGKIESELPAPVPVTKRLLSDRGTDAEGQPWAHDYRAAANPDGTFLLERVVKVGGEEQVQRLGKDGSWTADGAPQTFKTLKWAAEAAMEQKAAQSRDGLTAPRAEAPHLPEFDSVVPEPSPRFATGEGQGMHVDTLRDALAKSREGQAASHLIDTGAVVLHRSADTLPSGAAREMGGVKAMVTEDGTIHMVADNLTEGTARAVLLHEAFHQGAEQLLTPETWGGLMRRMEVLMKQGGDVGEFFAKARERVNAARESGAVRPEHEAEELAAYAIEAYESAPPSVRRVIDNLIGQLKAAILRTFGKQMGDVSAAQLSALAKTALKEAAKGKAAARYSVGEGRTIEVDGVRRPIVDSNGNLLAKDFAGQLEFWRKYGDGPVDEKGRPILEEGPRYSVGKIPDGPAGEAPRRLKKLAAKLDSISTVKKARESVGDLVHEIELTLMPMSDRNGSAVARAYAKDYANAERTAQWQWSYFDKVLEKNYTPEQRKLMWEAADEQNVLLQQGLPTKGKGLDRLDDGQKATMEVLHQYGEELLQRAKAAGLFKGEGLPYWAPRMAVMIDANGEYSTPPLRGEGGGGTATVGRNMSTNASSLKQRKYLTVEETEAAGLASVGEGFTIVRDIRTMPMAMARLERAIATRELVNGVKEIGRKAGKETVSSTERPDFFTIDHPAFKTFRPRMIENEEGKLVAAHDENGDMMFDKVPVYVSKEFEGPLKSVMSEKSGALYNGLMALKGKAMGVIMYSPLIHNMVEFGRALPMMPGKMITLQVYFEGNKVKNDPEMMRFFMDKGMVPIGSRGGIQDITGLLENPELNPGRSWTAKVLAAPVSLVSKDAALAVKRGVDKAGDFWHNTLLWDRIGDLQAGLAINIYKAETARLIKKGLTPEQAKGTAGYLAAHMANRYAGALPNEAMSAMSRKFANLALFSRSFTLGNIGVMKDMLTGLPAEVKAQITRDYGELAARAGTDEGRRKAIAAFIIDVGLMYAANSLLQDVFDHWKRDKTWTDVAQGYVDRFTHLIHKGKESPMSVLNPLTAMEELSSTAGNEPGKKERILYDFDKSGTAIYTRLPLGKIGEEFVGWGTSPLEMMKRKESTFTRPLIETFTNDKGFGKRVYNPDDPGVAGATRNVGKIVTNFMKAQLPVDAIQGITDMSRGSGDETTPYKVLGPLAGLTFSKGAPGGPAVGEMYHAENIYRGKKADIMPDVNNLIRQQKTDEAIEMMRSIGMPNAEINTILRYAENPGARLSPGSMRRFGKHSDDAAKERMQQQLDQRR